MALTPGTRVGPYEIHSPLGVGGMGEVYRATDTVLGRQVAIKVLPEVFAQDSERLARFEREARTLAALNHPNIAQIHGFEKSGGVPALVMELVEGPTLADRVAQGPVPVSDALPIAKQIAEALEVAHEQGIIHRDLKPANIKVRPDGTVKVLDFGLAKAMDPVAQVSGVGAVSVSQSPTITTPAMTHVGMILGTAAYMSPEQAKGKLVDKRSDIWAFGCVLYEMLTGRRAFDREDVSETLAAVLMKEPDLSSLPVSTPPAVRLVLQRSLQKDPKQRLRDIGEARLALDGTFVLPTVLATNPSSGLLRRAAPWALAALVVLVALAFAVRQPPEVLADPVVTRTLIDVAPAERVSGANPVERRPDDSLLRPSRTAIALSPDGRFLAFGGTSGETQRLFVRSLDRLEATPLEGTEGGEAPFFSPDGVWIGFWADGELKKVPAAGGPPVTITKAVEPFGASWGSEDSIVYAGTLGEPIWEVSASGGAPRPATQLSAGEYMHKAPAFLPDGRSMLFTIQRSRSRWDDTSIAVKSLDTGEQRVLIEHGADARYLASGHMSFMREATLMIVPFDLARLEVAGGAVGAITNVMQGINPRNGSLDSGAGQYSVSQTGNLAYIAGGVVEAVRRQMTWFDRTGRSSPIVAPLRPYGTSLRLSADGRQIVVMMQDSIRSTWIFDLERNTIRPLLPGTVAALPLFSPDGSRVAFSSISAVTGGFENIHWMPTDASRPAERLTTNADTQHVNSFSPDGQTLLFVQGIGGRYDLFSLELRSRMVQPVRTTAADERQAAFSPDGRWIAFTSNESGRDEVYLQRYPGSARPLLVSTEGGSDPAWNPNGKEIFFVRVLDESRGHIQMHAVDIGGTSDISVGRPRLLFETLNGRFASAQARGYDVSPDGQRFLTVVDVKQDPPVPPRTIIHVANWFEELKRLVPVD